MVHCETPRTAAETSTISFKQNPPTWFTQTHALHSPFKSLVNWDLVDILLNICLLATLVVAKSPEAALLLPSGRFSQSRPNQERRLVLFHWKGFGFGTTHNSTWLPPKAEFQIGPWKINSQLCNFKTGLHSIYHTHGTAIYLHAFATHSCILART